VSALALSMPRRAALSNARLTNRLTRALKFPIKMLDFHGTLEEREAYARQLESDDAAELESEIIELSETMAPGVEADLLEGLEAQTIFDRVKVLEAAEAELQRCETPSIHGSDDDGMSDADGSETDAPRYSPKKPRFKNERFKYVPRFKIAKPIVAIYACRNCRQKGHNKNECPNEKVIKVKVIKRVCKKCGEAHGYKKCF
jgi:hypothetical protein